MTDLHLVQQLLQAERTNYQDKYSKRISYGINSIIEKLPGAREDKHFQYYMTILDDNKIRGIYVWTHDPICISTLTSHVLHFVPVSKKPESLPPPKKTKERKMKVEIKKLKNYTHTHASKRPHTRTGGPQERNRRNR